MSDSQDFVHKYISRLQDMIDQHDSVILSGNVEDFTHYKEKIGMRRGLYRAITEFKELVKKGIDEDAGTI